MCLLVKTIIILFHVISLSKQLRILFSHYPNVRVNIFVKCKNYTKNNNVIFISSTLGSGYNVGQIMVWHKMRSTQLLWKETPLNCCIEKRNGFIKSKTSWLLSYSLDMRARLAESNLNTLLKLMCERYFTLTNWFFRVESLI